MTDKRAFQTRLHGSINSATWLSKPVLGSPELCSDDIVAKSGLALNRGKAKIVIIAAKGLISDCLTLCLQELNGYEVDSIATVAEWIDVRSTHWLPLLILLCTIGHTKSASDIEDDLVTLLESGSEVPIVLLSDGDHANRIQAAFNLGARGYIPTNLPLDVASSALRVIEVGGTFVPALSLFELRTDSAPRFQRPKRQTDMLTARQTEVGEAVRQGKGNKQIASELDITQSTVKLHIRIIMRKLGAKNRTELAVKMDKYYSKPIAPGEAV